VMEFTDKPPPVSEQELAAAEAKLAELGQHIPPSYKAFLAEQDGGKPVRSVFDFEQDNRPQSDYVKRFLGLAPVPPPGENLLDTAESLWTRVPEGVLPIARDPFGNLICLDGRDGGDGPVLFWDHEYEGDPPDEANLYVIAPDLHTFLDGLREPEPRPPASKPKGLKRLFGRGGP
jgi:SMI1 / KNR4 family (SUKH-1)